MQPASMRTSVRELCCAHLRCRFLSLWPLAAAHRCGLRRAKIGCSAKLVRSRGCMAGATCIRARASLPARAPPLQSRTKRQVQVVQHPVAIINRVVTHNLRGPTLDPLRCCTRDGQPSAPVRHLRYSPSANKAGLRNPTRTLEGQAGRREERERVFRRRVWTATTPCLWLRMGGAAPYFIGGGWQACYITREFACTASAALAETSTETRIFVVEAGA
eukprot:366131-Chlamydomonas_euryale.AAC.32